jgi:GTP pyrophosphokinase
MAEYVMSEILREYIRELLKEMPVKTDFVNTYKTAQQVHRGQKRRTGEDYFEHPKAVRNIVVKMYPADRVAQLAALLHDTLEDYEKGGVYGSEEEVIEAITSGIEDPSETDQVLSAVQALTHSGSVPYSSYLIGLADNQTALRVKLADMLHNSTTSPSVAQKAKYKKAFGELLVHFNGSLPGITQKHIDALNVILNTA